MNANFAHCLAFTLRYEGGAVDDPRDPGGRTNQGVTQRTFSTWLKRRGEAPRDVFSMRTTERDAIYKGGFWDQVGADRLPDGVDLVLFDFGVNSGPTRALQAYSARKGADPTTMVKAVCARRSSFLQGLRSFRIYGRGWAARVAACEALGVKMAEHARIGVPVDAAVVPQVASTLNAESRAAHHRAVRMTKASGAMAVTGGAAQPAVGAVAHVTWMLIGLSALVLLGVITTMLWNAWQARQRAAAYAVLASN